MKASKIKFMEKLKLKAGSKKSIINYRDDNHLVAYEREIITDILNAIELNDVEKLEWFNQFGDDIRCVIVNAHDYRKGLEFGFTEIAFGTYKWLKRAEFLDKEDLKFGNLERYSDHSIVHLGRGANGVWTYALNYSFGLAGGGYGLSIYGKQFKTRQAALSAGMAELKNMLTLKLGDKDSSNYKQAIILATLRDIKKLELSLVQMTLF
jgi:hypothetical protein